MDGNGGEVNMEKAKESLRLTEEDTEPVSRFAVPAHRAGDWSSFYEDFALRALEASESTESNPDSSSEQSRFLPASPAENANGAIANLVDVVGSYVDYVEGLSDCFSGHVHLVYVNRYASCGLLKDQQERWVAGCVAKAGKGRSGSGRVMEILHGLKLLNRDKSIKDVLVKVDSAL